MLDIKKSQVSHVFIFAIGIIVLALILIFGYKVFQELRTKGEETEVIHFKTKLKNDIGIIKEGDIYQKSYTIPKGYREVCFVDDDITSGFLWRSEFHNDCGKDWLNNEPALSNAIIDKVKDDVFLVGESKVDSIFVGNIDLGNYKDDGSCSAYDGWLIAVYCFEIKNSKLNIQLEGIEDIVLIKKPENA